MRSILSFALIAPAFFIACSGGSSDDTDTGDTDTGDNGGENGGGATFEDFVNVSETYLGDASCYDGTNWLAQTVGAGCTADVTVAGVVQDFQTEEAVPDATVEFWNNDDINSSSSDSFDVDSNGNGTVTLPACSPVGYKTSTPVEWEETVDTFEVHQVYGFEASGATDDTWNSVSVATSRLIPSLLGLEWDPGTAIIAGTAYDCNTEPIQYAQVFIHDGAGNIPEGIAIRYFSGGLPNADQPSTNDDGLWSAINIPPGDWVVEMWVNNGTELQLIGATNLTMQPDSVVVSNIYTGIDDGVYYPSSCLSSCE